MPGGWNTISNLRVFAITLEGLSAFKTDFLEPHACRKFGKLKKCIWAFRQIMLTEKEIAGEEHQMNSGSRFI